MYQKFIVLSHPRTGSNYVIDLLGSHPSIVTYGELFSPGFLLGSLKPAIVKRWPFIYHAYTYIRERFPLVILKHVVFRHYRKKVSAVGFKIFYEHAHTGKSKAVWPFLRETEGLKIIHLKRRNILRSYVSYLIANRTGEFIRFSTNAPPRAVRVKVNIKRCRARFSKIERDRAKFEKYFSGHDILTVWYEDLCARPQQQLRKIQSFLGVSAAPLYSTVVKQNTGPLWEIVSNYRELRKAFARTRWAAFFDDISHTTQ